MVDDNNKQEAELTKQSDDKPFPLTEGLSTKDFLDVVWKIAAGLSVTCYLVGAIVMNIHFTRFGYYSVSLANAQYFIAGIWAIAPVALAWFFVLYTLLRSPGLLPRPRKDKMGAIVFILLIVGVVVSFFLLTFFSARIERFPLQLKWIVHIGTGFFLTLPIVAFFWWVNPLRSLTKEWIPLTIVSAFFAGFFWLAYLQAFSRNLYGEISGTLGGGKPRLVRLVVRSEAREDMIAAGINFPQDSRTSGLLKLLTSTEKEYIVLTGTGNSSTSVRGDVVQAVLYEGENK